MSSPIAMCAWRFAIASLPALWESANGSHRTPRNDDSMLQLVIGTTKHRLKASTFCLSVARSHIFQATSDGNIFRTGGSRSFALYNSTRVSSIPRI